ncbi:hypothetical protein BT63DRAFT_452692 [Microthyrium microscopicum]|uniref:C2H2-type domain-containing protein n=1 Tax=Microthyrium microscopicum TaxID=703497 RepID=A0A6A6UIU6_9PEZI|nr:hypothetical protein BT63DRAFT_452692 [Microthyrium microscopicum]
MPGDDDTLTDVEQHEQQPDQLQDINDLDSGAVLEASADALLNSSSSNSKEPFSVLTRIPDDVQEYREKVYLLEEPATFTAETWAKYWPFIDNVWCLHNRLDAPMGLARGHTEKFWGGCRLQRKWDHTSSNPPAKGIRNRVRRPTGTCTAKFKLTVLPDGSRILERSTKEGHSHDLDHIDSIKRNSGVRSLVLDPFFNSWEPATIMAYLRDPDHFVNGRDMLTEAGGKYLERREIMNIFSQHLRKLYPGIDVSSIKKEQDKYKAMKTCNFKGCNRSFPDGKALMAHRKVDHPASEGRQHDHSHRKYTCPQKGCHRKKKSKGFPSLLALHEHQIKMEHWGSGSHHTEEGPVPCPPIIEGETYGDMQAMAGAAEDEDTTMMDSQSQVDNSGLADTPSQSHLSVPQQPLPGTDNSLLPLLAAHGVQSMVSQSNMMPIDPAMHSQPLPARSPRPRAIAPKPANPQTSVSPSMPSNIQPDLPASNQASNSAGQSLTDAEKAIMMERYWAMQAEMDRMKQQGLFE